jgi:hypothetical protein
MDIGRPGYAPATMLKIYIYGYLNRIPSSRRLERECQRNLELIWLTGKLAPDFKTIADFRKENGKAIAAVCRAFVELCRKLNFRSWVLRMPTRIRTAAPRSIIARDGPEITGFSFGLALDQARGNVFRRRTASSRSSAVRSGAHAAARVRRRRIRPNGRGARAPFGRHAHAPRGKTSRMSYDSSWLQSLKSWSLRQTRSGSKNVTQWDSYARLGWRFRNAGLSRQQLLFDLLINRFAWCE